MSDVPYYLAAPNAGPAFSMPAPTNYVTAPDAGASRPFFANGWEAFGFMGGVTSTLMGALGTYYSTRSQQHELKSRAMDAEFQSSMANINARAAEEDAQAEIEAGQIELARVTAQYGQVKQDTIASAAARGVEGASVQESLASIELAKQTDSLIINRNSVRRANARRAEAVNMRNSALIGRQNARNLRGTAGSLSPATAARGSLLQGASTLASQWMPRQRY